MTQSTHQDIDLIIFDLGNVLIEFDPSMPARKLTGVLKGTQGELLTTDQIQRLIAAPTLQGKNQGEECGCGRITSRELTDMILSQLDNQVAPDVLIEAMHNIFIPMPERIAYFHDLLDAGYNVALLSDTVPADIQAIQTAIPYALAPLPEERRFYSFNIGAMKKHGPEAYRHVLKTLGAQPHRTLMIDDRLQNKAGADTAGIHFAHIEPHQNLGTILEKDWGISPDKSSKEHKIMYDIKSARHLKESDEHSMAVPLIFYRTNQDGEKEIALLVQDNAPLWRTFGNGFAGSSAQKMKKRAVCTALMRTASSERKPISLCVCAKR